MGGGGEASLPPKRKEKEKEGDKKKGERRERERGGGTCIFLSYNLCQASKTSLDNRYSKSTRLKPCNASVIPQKLLSIVMGGGGG